MSGKTIINNEVLRSNLENFITFCSHNNHFYANLFQFQFYTGCRLGECTGLNRIVANNDRTLTVHTLKGGNDRIITIDDLPEWLLHSLLVDPSQFTHCNASTAAYYFRALFELYPLRTATKVLTTHLFRHSIVKYKYDNGQDFVSISNWLGEKDIKNTMGYYRSVITH